MKIVALMSKGDLIEFESNEFSEIGPSLGKIIKATVDLIRVQHKSGTVEEIKKKRLRVSKIYDDEETEKRVWVIK